MRGDDLDVVVRGLSARDPRGESIGFTPPIQSAFDRPTVSARRRGILTPSRDVSRCAIVVLGKADDASLNHRLTSNASSHPDGGVPQKGGRASPCDSALAS